MKLKTKPGGILLNEKSVTSLDFQSFEIWIHPRYYKFNRRYPLKGNFSQIIMISLFKDSDRLEVIYSRSENPTRSNHQKKIP